jgi:hypothetical protein
VAPFPVETVGPRGRLSDHVLGFSPAATFLERHRRHLSESRRVRVIEPAANLAPYDVQVHGGRIAAIRTLGLDEATRSSAGLGNGAMFIVPRMERDERVLSAASQLLGRSCGNGTGTRALVRRVAVAPDVLLFEFYRRLSRKIPALAVADRVSARARLRNTLAVGPSAGWSRLRHTPTSFDAHHVIEQFPDYERRITLGERRDSLGRAVPALRFFVSDAELDSLERTQEIIRAELAHLGVGALSTTRDLVGAGDIRESMHPSAHHHLGTTRMDANTKRGVVDPNGRLHGSGNVYVTGGSVFPTVGYVNPTLTIVALAARLGSHIADQERA